MPTTACGPSISTNMKQTPNSSCTATNVDYVDCDFLIVGAGSAGCVLASRLVRQGLKVLLVEAGPADARKQLRAPEDWLQAASCGDELSEVFMTVPQKGLNNRRLHAYRGKGGGGTGNVNSVLYFRGSKEDYDTHWPWDVKDIEASFKSIETELALETNQSPGTIGPSYDRMLEEVGFKYASAETSGTQNDPQNDDDEEEVTWTRKGLEKQWKTTTADHGAKRRTAWDAFVNPVMTMPNLRIKDDAFVSRVVIEEGRAVGVELLECGWGSWLGVGRATRQLRFPPGSSAEIVLCGGAFRTPKLLMLSGVGPKSHLEAKGIEVVVDSPQVGSNLQDHMIVVCVNLTKTPTPATDCARLSVHGHVYFSCRLEASQNARAISAPASGENIDSAAASPAESSADHSADSSSAPVVGFMYWDGTILGKYMNRMLDLALQKPGIIVVVLRFLMCSIAWILTRFTPVGALIRRRMRGMTLMLTTVKSKGTVRLKSKDARAPADIDPAYLSHPDDVRAFCEGWRVLRRTTQDTVEGKESLGLELAPGSGYNNGKDDESALRFIRDSALSFFHPIGTCRMGEGFHDSVVSPETLRVHGVSGLRIADASVAPHIPHTPTQAMAMMIGDRAAAIALKDRFTKERMQANMAKAASQSIN